MVRKFVAVAMIGGSLALSGCNLVRGAGEDLQSAANCTEELMKQGRC